MYLYGAAGGGGQDHLSENVRVSAEIDLRNPQSFISPPGGETTKFNHSSRNVDQTAALKGTGAPGGLCGYKKPLHRIMYRGFADLLGR